MLFPAYSKIMGFMDRVEDIRSKLLSDIGFDVIPLTPEELEKKLQNIFYREISKYWIEIRGD